MRPVVLVPLLCLLASSPAALATDQTRAIIAKAIQAHGGKEAVQKLKAMTWKADGTMIFGNNKQPYQATYYWQAPDKFRFDMAVNLGGNAGTFTVIVNGDRGWEKFGDRTRVMDGRSLKGLRQTCYMIYLSTLAPLLDPSLQISAVSELQRDGRTLVGIKVGHDRFNDVSLYFDRDTGLLAMARTTIFTNLLGRETEQESLYEDYTKANGRVYFKRLVIQFDGKPVMIEKMGETKISDRLPAKLFEQ